MKTMYVVKFGNDETDAQGIGDLFEYFDTEKKAEDFRERMLDAGFGVHPVYSELV